jgi:hypothetical protein
MLIKAKVFFSSEEEKQETISILLRNGEIVESSKKNNFLFVTLTKSIVDGNKYYIPEEIQGYEYDLIFKAEEVLPVNGISSVVCGKRGRPLRPFFVERDKMNNTPYAAHFNVLGSVGVVELSSEVSVRLFEIKRDGKDLVGVDVSNPYNGDISHAGSYLPAAKAAALKNSGKMGVCYYDPQAREFYESCIQRM